LTRIGRAVGAGRARDLVLRGRRFDARQAEQWGIVSVIAGAGEHVKRATEIAHEFAGQSPVALRVTKRVLDASLGSPKDTALLLEQLAYAVLNETG
jgi:enoyl-CoA hydratase/carnithine racemase